ncbi:TetR/AcrR family transcriptional regulator [Amycolatopsis alkalitolerans]|uniref:TetR/AcrR family transcriptional regulator n=1 Tax=Amycolatopsis alkalitolerans TaxID=2547244 RepID=A0A5C4M3Q7_9PSEU|nr:TetR/AcrR family transcriptional regulator [Amycolatopsis alkalitolerans]TNC24634.1 TetR/AcrR family transcriptional regulator [Amycolatopsis alkalitolerans]
MTGTVERRRRVGTRRQILDVAVEVMAERGVAGLSLSEVARRVGIRQPSLYKHFASLHAVYDEVFREGAEHQRDAVARAVRGSAPGLTALLAAIEAIGRLAMANPVVAQLLSWRPVPDFTPSEEAFRPSIEMVEIVRATLRDAVAAGELDPAADSDDGVALVSILVSGALTQQLANEPDAGYEAGRFSSLLPRAFAMFVQYFAPKAEEQP